MLAYHSGLSDSGHCTLMSVTARKDQAQNYGCIVADDDGMVMHYVEKVRADFVCHLQMAVLSSSSLSLHL